MRKHSKKVLTILLCLQIGISFGQKAGVPTPERVVHDFYGDLLRSVQLTEGLSAPVAARLFGYLGLCVYEGHRLYSPAQNEIALSGYQPIAASPSTTSQTIESVVLITALTTLSDSLVSTWQAHDLKRKHLLSSAVSDHYEGDARLAPSIALGRNLAQALYTYSKTDGGHRAEKANYDKQFSYPRVASKWQPQPMQQALLPRWGSLRTFAPANATLSLPEPVSFDTSRQSAFYQSAMEVAQYGSRCSVPLRQTAAHWSDGFGTMTPAGHTLGVVRDIMMAENTDLDATARTYAMLGMALSDALVLCWRAKYQYGLLRPIDYIRTYIDPAWQAAFLTPPFPEYPSGHATQAGAAEHIFSLLIGSDRPCADNTFGRMAALRHYPSFAEMVREICDSRVYAGVHYRFSNQAGQAAGHQAAQAVAALFGLRPTDMASVSTAKQAVHYDAAQHAIAFVPMPGCQSVKVTTLGGGSVGTAPAEQKEVKLGMTKVDAVLVQFLDKAGSAIHTETITILEVTRSVNQRTSPHATTAKAKRE